jgi:hypothetical protein
VSSGTVPSVPSGGAVRHGVLGDGDDRRVLQLPGEGVGHRALVGRRGGETDVGQIVPVGEVRHDQRRVGRGGHPGQRQGRAHGGDDRGHGLRFHRIPQLHHGQPVTAARGQPQQLGDQVLAQGAAGAVVHQRRLAAAERAGGVPYGAAHGAVGRGRQVVVQGDGAGHRTQDLLHGGPAGVAVQPAHHRDGQPGLVPAAHRAPRPGP